MPEPGEYKIVDRRKFAVTMVVLVSLVAIGVWLTLDALADYTDQLETLATEDPHSAAALIRQLLVTFAIVNWFVLISLAALIVVHGARGWRTESMPPRGSWILSGQRTWSGEGAVRIARFTVVMGILLGVLALISSWVLWNLGDTLGERFAAERLDPDSVDADG